MSSDLAQFFDFSEASTSASVASQQRPIVDESLESNQQDLCLEFQGDCVTPEILQEQRQTYKGPQEFNSDFSSWLPRYQKPPHPCDYCRSRSLECFIYNASGDKSAGCSPCNALFRTCSFSDPAKMPMLKSKTALDTLDVVAEDSERLVGGLTGKKPMRSLGHVGPIDDDNGDAAAKKGAAAARFPRAAVKILKDWMIEHIEHPYPTEEEKEHLKTLTGLTVGQISNWMANTRRRQKARPKRSASPSIRPSTDPINIPPGRTWESLDPFERWKHSPPENEPAPMTAIARAVETFDLPTPSSATNSYSGRKENSNESTSSFSVFRAPSTTSLETGLTNMSSGSHQSHTSVWSYGSRNSFGSLNSLGSKKKEQQRRRRRMPTRTAKPDTESGPRMFQCTFCTDRFKSKYDWSRHEKSLHLSLEKWICAPIGEVITCSSSGQRKCVYCDALDPTKEHLEVHNHRACEEKGLEARTFYRKDHLRQHLRLMHGCKMMASMDSWKSEAQLINSRCGFCGMTFDKWQDRVDHLSKEFRSGANMKDWKGCRGLDAHVAAHVTNAMPPYLIANESKSPLPFSASNSASMKQHSMCLRQDDLEYLLPNDQVGLSGVLHQMDEISSPLNLNSSSSSTSPNPHPNATCWEILTLRLGRFVRQRMEQDGADAITDELLQQEARHILYDNDDPWNQTAADNPEWLNLFKKSHGINAETSKEFISQHEVLEDLGLSSTAQLDPSFNLDNFGLVENCQRDPNSQSFPYECVLAGTLNITKAMNRLSGSTTPLTLEGFALTSDSGSIHPTTTSSLTRLSDPIPELPCTAAGEMYLDENGELGMSNLAELPHLPMVKETPCTAAGDPLRNHAPFPTLDDMPVDLESLLPANSLGHFSSASVNAAGIDAVAGSVFDHAAGLDINVLENIYDDRANPHGMHWDDTELDFDMDLDLNLTTDLDITMG